jgi:hypothetical protein
MRSSRAGRTISRRRRRDVEVLSIAEQGLWLYVDGEEHLLPYRDHPWFRDARVRDILNVELLHGIHLYWPDLDVDLHVDSLRVPERFPLKSKKKRRIA